MKNIKKTLKEYREYKTIDMISYRWIPLSTNLMKKVFGDKRISTFHLTDIRELYKLKKLEGRRSSISTFNKLNSLVRQLKKGPLTRGGVMVWLEGDLITRFASDSTTDVDEKGRRWVAWSQLVSKAREDYRDLPRELIDLSIKVHQIKNKEFKNKKDDSPEGNKEKAKIIKRYIDVAYKFVLKNKDDIVKSSLANHTSSSGAEWNNWNEVVVNAIKVKGIVILDSDEFDWLWDGDPKKLEDEVKNIKRTFPSAEVIVDSSGGDFMKYYKKWGGELVL